MNPLGLRREVGIPLKIPFGNGPQLPLKDNLVFLELKQGSSRVAAGFLLSYDGDLRDPLMGPQGGPVST